MKAPPETVEALLRRMVALNTVNTVSSGDLLAEAKLAADLCDVARLFGFSVRRLPVAGRGHNLLIELEVNRRAPWIMFESHMDTVSTEGMTVEPLAGRVKSGTMWGRGVCDTKGTGAAMLWALRSYASGSSTSNNVAILFSIDEEYGMVGVRSFVRNDLPKLGYHPRCVIVGEPTLLRPVVAHNGVVRWRITVTGKAAHSATPELGDSAISAMVHVIDAIESQYIPSLTTKHPLTGQAKCSINVIRGGTQINIVAESCTIDIDRRTVPGEDGHAVLPTIQGLLDRLGAREPAINARQEPIFTAPPLSHRASELILPEVQRIMAHCDLPIDPIGGGYATDAGDLAAAGLPTLVLGPGDMAKAHTKDECLELNQLHRGVEVYLAIMEGNWGEGVNPD